MIRHKSERMNLLQLLPISLLVSGLCNCHYNCLTWSRNKTDLIITYRMNDFLLPVTFIGPSGTEQGKCNFNSSMAICLSHHKNWILRADEKKNQVTFEIKDFKKFSINGEWTCTEGPKRFTTIVSTSKGLLESTDVHIDGYIQSPNKAKLKCFSCREPEFHTVEFLINNRSADTMVYNPLTTNCLHGKGKCHPNICTCSKSGNEFSRVFSYINSTNFSCEMKFSDVILSQRFQKIATVIFNGTGFTKLPTITEVTKTTEDINDDENGNKTRSTKPTNTTVIQTEGKWIAIAVFGTVILIFVIPSVHYLRKKRKKDVVLTNDKENEGPLHPYLTENKNDDVVGDNEETTLMMHVMEHKNDDVVADNDERTLVLHVMENVTDDKEAAVKIEKVIEDSRNVNLHDMQNVSLDDKTFHPTDALNEDVLCSNLNQYSQVAVTNKGPALIEVISEFDKVSLRGHLISGIAVTEDGIVLLSDSRKPNVLFFDKTGKYLSTTAVQYTPWDIVAIPNSKMAVASSKTNPFIQFINTQSHKLKTSKKLEGRLGGGIACSMENIFVGGMNRIFVLDHEGSYIRIVWNDSFKNILIRYLSFKDEKFYFTGSEYNFVVGMTQTGVECTEIKSSVLQTPMKVVFDRQGEMYILGGGSDNVVRATNLGEVMKPTLTNDNGINCPWTLCFSNDYRYLYISNQNGTSVLLCKLTNSKTVRTCTS